MKIKYWLCIPLFVLLFSCSTGTTPEGPVINIGRTVIEVELADTPEKRQQGLMNRKSLEAGTGMLFIFEKEQHVPFWMKDTSIPLSVAYINSNGKITEIHELVPYSQKMIWSSHPIKYALEVNRGFFRQKNIKVGDTVEVSDLK